MSFIIGIRSFLIKSYSCNELGFEIESDLNSRIEFRQGYFHVFWIPFFGLGKIILLKRDGVDYVITKDFKYQSKVFSKLPKTPWYTYLGLFLSLIGYLVFLGTVEIKNNNLITLNNDIYEDKIRKINTPKINDVYTLNAQNNKSFILIIDNFNKDSISFKAQRILSDSITQENPYPDMKTEYIKIWVDKNNLKQISTCNDLNNEFAEGKSIKKLELLSNEKLILNKIERFISN